ncbi:GntR family transcriptional regulator [Clostridium sp. MT-14]|uniref:GntR family transcriptional regulator n=1 Tax=Clostridium aromativorans TaxID=2836848 RepID=A0ABS8N830_9CLOT|nr:MULTISPECIES: GntR family transcriptional regulator [Clostridium]KAA8677575.1 GntR family transcriptional regulator [Clostridium sp. HV4-5-A1G]MCC9295816.1 GntR family transcriptional regulator [Clostridium aromativorans]CAB1246717.1 FCD domain-containing protein [Clostridiaceae bacterium BL-3]
MTLVTGKNLTSKKLYQILKEDIIHLDLKPGLSISEKGISEKFNISRTPVREAFLLLSQEGLLDIYPQKGTFVSLIDLDAVEEARFLREHVERAVVRLACKQFPEEKLIFLKMNLEMQKMSIKKNDYTRAFKLDEQFHKTIFEGCNKERTWDTICQVEMDFQRIRVLTLSSNLKIDDVYSQHKIIIEAIKNEKPEKADEIMKNHLTMVNYNLKDVKERYPQYFK